MRTATQSKPKNLSRIPIDYEWSFADKTIKDTAYITHGYYTYPAKFIPQLSARLIHEYSKPGNVVVDPFMGSGTTVVEAIVNRRIGVGTDINEIAVLLAKVKSTPIEHSLLTDEFFNLMEQLRHQQNGYSVNGYSASIFKIADGNIKASDKIDYWFKPHVKTKLHAILPLIMEIKNADVREFFLVAFAQILKSCSIWMQKSVKPTRDFDKKEVDPIAKFEWQAKRMIKKHAEFNCLVTDKIKANIAKFRNIKNGDARNLPCTSGRATLIITSPPYVTSYEYADLHQLASLWFGYLDELPTFRKKFIGSSARTRDKIELKSSVAEQIVHKLGKNKKSIEVENYFADMLESFIEMRRVLKVGGRAAVVIGNTKLRGVEILNAEVFQQQFESIGFRTEKIVHREVPSKMLPSTRDPKTGKFAKAVLSGKSLAYPTEYILIMRKEL